MVVHYTITIQNHTKPIWWVSWCPFLQQHKKDQVRTHTTANFGFGVGSYCGFAADCHDTSGRITRLCFQDPYTIPTKSLQNQEFSCILHQISSIFGYPWMSLQLLVFCDLRMGQSLDMPYFGMNIQIYHDLSQRFYAVSGWTSGRNFYQGPVVQGELTQVPSPVR